MTERFAALILRQRNTTTRGDRRRRPVICGGALAQLVDCWLAYAVSLEICMRRVHEVSEKLGADQHEA